MGVKLGGAGPLGPPPLPGAQFAGTAIALGMAVVRNLTDVGARYEISEARQAQLLSTDPTGPIFTERVPEVPASALVATLTALDLDGQSIKLPVTPAEYRTKHSPSWTGLQPIGVINPRSAWIGNAPDVFNLRTRQVVARTETNPSLSPLLSDIQSTLIEWAKRPAGATQYPTRVVYSQGIFSFVGHITDLSFDIEQMANDGTPIVYTLNLELTQ